MGRVFFFPLSSFLGVSAGSLEDRPAIDVQGLAGDSTGQVAAEEDDERSDLLGGDHALLRARLLQPAADIGRLLASLGHDVGDAGVGHGRLHVARADRVHGDPARRHLEGGHPGEAQDTVLARGVGGDVGHGRLAGDGRHVDDAAPSPLRHLRQRLAGGEEDAREVDGQDRVPLLVRGLGEGRGGGYARPVDQDVDAPQGFADGPEERLHFVSPAQVGGEGEGLHPEGEQLLFHLVQLRPGTRRHRHVGSLPGELEGRDPPDPASAPGHEGPASAQAHDC